MVEAPAQLRRHTPPHHLGIPLFTGSAPNRTLLEKVQQRFDSILERRPDAKTATAASLSFSAFFPQRHFCDAHKQDQKKIQREKGKIKNTSPFSRGASLPGIVELSDPWPSKRAVFYIESISGSAKAMALSACPGLLVSPASAPVAPPAAAPQPIPAPARGE